MRVQMTPRPCMQCQNAPCVEVCPVKASYRGEDGIVVVDANRCIGCRYCIAACPYGARSVDEGMSYAREMQAADQVVVPEYGVERKAHIKERGLQQGVAVSPLVGEGDIFKGYGSVAGRARRGGKGLHRLGLEFLDAQSAGVEIGRAHV